MIIGMCLIISFLQEVVELSLKFSIFFPYLYLAILCTVRVNCDPWSDRRCGEQGFSGYFVYFKIWGFFNIYVIRYANKYSAYLLHHLH